MTSLIALLARHALGLPSPDWLGRHAADSAIRQSGLWNTQHIGAEPLTADELAHLARLAGVHS